MLSAESVAKLKSLARDVVEREGCLLYDIEFSAQGKNRVLRVYIDRESEPVSVDNCANVSRGLSLILDVQDVIPGGQYELEVSSPGLERILKEAWHFKKAIGSPIKITTVSPIPELKGHCMSVTGPLLEATDEAVMVKPENTEPVEKLQVPLSNIKRAQVLFRTIKNEKKR